MQKFLFVIFLIADVVSVYKLIESFPTFMSRMFGFSACLFFINALLILWTNHLIRQPEEIQKKIILQIGEKSGVVTRSLYEILHNRWSKTKRFYILYIDSIFSLFVAFYLAFLTSMYSVTGRSNVADDLKSAFSLDLLPYYVGFCLGALMIIATALIKNDRNSVMGLLRKEFMIKVIQTVFVTAFFGAGPAIFMIALTSFMRISRQRAT